MIIIQCKKKELLKKESPYLIITSIKNFHTHLIITSINSKLSPSNNPLSDILIDGITNNAMNAIVMNGAST